MSTCQKKQKGRKWVTLWEEMGGKKISVTFFVCEIIQYYFVLTIYMHLNKNNFFLKKLCGHLKYN